MDDHDFDPAGGSAVDNNAAGSTADSGTDDQLMVELRRVVRMVDPVPEGVLAAARAAIATRDLDGELAELVADTGLQTDTGMQVSSGTRVATEPVRSGTPRRLLSFTCGPVQIDLEITTGSDRLVGIVGQLSGGSTTDCVLEYPGGRQPVSPDTLGRFSVTGARSGPMRVRCRSAAGARVTTAWVTL